MLKVAICDDVPQTANYIGELLEKYNSKIFDISIYYSSNKLIQQMDSIDFDFFLLDIEMPQNSGIAIAEKIREKNFHVPIIFLTSFRDYMEDVFKIQTFDYILKPVDEKRMYQLLDRVVHYTDSSGQKFIFSYNKKTYHLPNREILFFEKNKRQVIIHTATKEYISNMNTHEVIEQLGEDFVQIHASYIINILAVKEVGKNYVLLQDQSNQHTDLPISRKFKDEAYEKILLRKRGAF